MVELGMLKRLLWFVPLLLTFVIPGCQPKFDPVEPEFHRLELAEMSRGTVELVLRNPNRFAIEIDGLRYALTLGADTVASGARLEPVRMPAQDSVVAGFPFEMRFDLADLVAQASRIMSDTVKLELVGQYVLPTPLGKRRLPFSHARVIPLADEVRKITDRFRSLFE